MSLLNLIQNDIRRLLKYYDPLELLDLCEISENTYQLCNNEQLWKFLTYRDYGINEKKEDTWFNTYKSLVKEINIYIIPYMENMSHKNLWKKFDINDAGELLISIVYANLEIAQYENNQYELNIAYLLANYLAEPFTVISIKEDTYNRFNALKITYKINYKARDILPLLKESIRYYNQYNNYFSFNHGYLIII